MTTASRPAPPERARASVGGEGGIRTHVPVTRQDAFEAPPLRPLRYLSGARTTAQRTFYYSLAIAPHPDPRRSLKNACTRSRLFLADARHHLDPMIMTRQLGAAHGRSQGPRLG